MGYGSDNAPGTDEGPTLETSQANERVLKAEIKSLMAANEELRTLNKSIFNQSCNVMDEIAILKARLASEEHLARLYVESNMGLQARVAELEDTNRLLQSGLAVAYETRDQLRATNSEWLDKFTQVCKERNELRDEVAKLSVEHGLMRLDLQWAEERYQSLYAEFCKPQEVEQLRAELDNLSKAALMHRDEAIALKAELEALKPKPLDPLHRIADALQEMNEREKEKIKKEHKVWIQNTKWELGRD